MYPVYFSQKSKPLNELSGRNMSLFRILHPHLHATLIPHCSKGLRFKCSIFQNKLTHQEGWLEKLTKGFRAYLWIKNSHSTIGISQNAQLRVTTQREVTGFQEGLSIIGVIGLKLMFDILTLGTFAQTNASNTARV